MVTKGRTNQKLNQVVVDQVIDILDKAEDKEEKTTGYWYMRMPSPGVRFYSFDPPTFEESKQAKNL